MIFTKEQLDVFYQVYKDPVKFVETFVCELTESERELLDSIEADGNPRFLYNNRDTANKVTFLYVVWASIFGIDSTNLIAVPSLSSRIALEAELLNILTSLPSWLIEKVEMSGDIGFLRVRINESCELIICEADSYMLRGRTIKTCVVQDLIEVKDPDTLDDLVHFGHVFCPVGHNVIALYTNASTMSIG